MKNIKQLSTFALLTSALIVSGCSSDSDPVVSQDQGQNQDQQTNFSSTTIDASDYQAYTYFNLVTGEELSLTEDEAAASSDWHIGLRRTSIIVNGGDSGSANVAAALAASQDDFYNEGEADSNVFTAASADAEEEHLIETYDLSTLSFESDEIVPAIEGSGQMTGTVMDLGWYNYDTSTHQTSLNSDNYWLVKSSSGDSYGKFHATSYDRSSGLAASFEFDVQAEGTTQFAGSATFNADIPAEGGSECFDFDTNSTVDCSSAEWDVKLEFAGRSITLWTNGGVSGDGSGGAFGPLTSEEAEDYIAGDTINGRDFSSHYTSDSSEGLFSENSWYAYNLGGNHKLWPNYRTYIIDTDTTSDSAAKFKLQVTDYYSSLDTSGHVTIRYQEN